METKINVGSVNVLEFNLSNGKFFGMGHVAPECVELVRSNDVPPAGIWYSEDGRVFRGREEIV